METRKILVATFDSVLGMSGTPLMRTPFGQSWRCPIERKQILPKKLLAQSHLPGQQADAPSSEIAAAGDG